MLKRIIFKYILKTETGLKIGGGNSTFDIGGIDSPVIKNPITKEPYIPGSSIKGKMRSLYETSQHADLVFSPKNDGKPLSDASLDVCKVYGVSADRHSKGNDITITRAVFRDAALTEDSKDELEKALGENIYTEIKPENTINRLNSSAMPRFFERVPAGVKFSGEIVLTIFEGDDEEKLKNVIVNSIKLLEDSYLGGGGTRGSGKVKFDYEIIERTKDYYIENEA